jgi:hypothetical protein
MNIFQIMALLATILQVAPAILQAAEAAFAKGGWAALVAYLETLINFPHAGIDTKKLADVVDKLKAREGTF